MSMSSCHLLRGCMESRKVKSLNTGLYIYIKSCFIQCSLSTSNLCPPSLPEILWIVLQWYFAPRKVLVVLKYHAPRSTGLEKTCYASNSGKNNSFKWFLNHCPHAFTNKKGFKFGAKDEFYQGESKTLEWVRWHYESSFLKIWTLGYVKIRMSHQLTWTSIQPLLINFPSCNI